MTKGRKTKAQREKILFDLEDIKEIIKDLKGYISISFIKKDRIYTEVRLLANPITEKEKLEMKESGGRGYKDKDNHSITIYCFNRKRWTNVRLHSIIEVRAEGKLFLPIAPEKLASYKLVKEAK